MIKPLWTPSTNRSSNMSRFMSFVNKTHGAGFSRYDELYDWSIQNIPEFWADVWQFVEIKSSQPYTQVIDDITKMPDAKWFDGAKLNFAENLLRYRDGRTALIFKGEDREPVRLTYAKLYDEVAGVAGTFRAMGVKEGDRVAGYMPNMPETIIAMLATVSVGAIWSSCSPDFGTKGTLDRFGQIQPKVLITADGYFFKGKKFDSLKTVSDIVAKIPSIEKVIVVAYTNEKPDINAIPNAIMYGDFKSEKREIEFEQLPFSHPVYIMYSSGTTGLPKCMVQSGGGVLINQLKELVLHTDVTRDDTIFYFTTCGWMMWNWLTCALGTGATLVLYDGSPFYPDSGALWRLAQDEKITIFGTSAGYIRALEKSGARPMRDFALSALQTILSTGAPLSVDSFEYVYRDIKKDVRLSSISGGSDLNGCFALGNPLLPVYSGEIECRGLGMKVESYDENGKPALNKKGELVCSAPFPSMPIYFWDDPDGAKYHDAYFDVYPNVWRHGDYIEINNRGGVKIYGRSDATLNAGGVRIGTAEIYRELEKLGEIEDGIVIGQEWENDTRIILFVKLVVGHELTNELAEKIKRSLNENLTARHVPAKIIAVPDIPYTLNMKKVEVAVKKMVDGEPVLNRDALGNPESLDFFANLKELMVD